MCLLKLYSLSPLNIHGLKFTTSYLTHDPKNADTALCLSITLNRYKECKSKVQYIKSVSSTRESQFDFLLHYVCIYVYEQIKKVRSNLFKLI